MGPPEARPWLGGLLRIAGGWGAVRALRRGREAYRGDERTLGSSAFVVQVLREVKDEPRWKPAGQPRTVTVAGVIRTPCAALGLPPEALRGGGSPRAFQGARAGMAYLSV